MTSDKSAILLVLGLMAVASPVVAQKNGQQLNVDGISRAIGKPGDLSGELYKVSFPRSDLNVKIGNLAIKPALALMGWAGFVKSGDSAMTYGDLVVLEDEINPVISKLEENGIGLAALHNHVLHESPRVMFIHFMGHGDEVKMAGAIREAVGLTKTPFTAAPSSPEAKPELAAQIERIIRHDGSMGGRISHYNSTQRYPRGHNGRDDSRQHGYEHAAELST